MLANFDGWDLIINNSLEASQGFADGYFDFVYIDDDHSDAGITTSLAAWYPKVRPGGILAGHDYDNDSLSRIVRAFFDEKGMRLLTDELDWWGIKHG
jgi:predicted O-methyltransferase YrrM